jgi:hypothetical protein
MSFDQRGPLSPPQTASSYPTSSAAPPLQGTVTHKSHRLRTSHVSEEGSTFVPVVKFSQSFGQRNALRGVNPVYGGSTESIQQKQPQEGDVVAVARPGRVGADARAQGWTISITSSSPTEDEIQVEIQQHLEPTSRPQPQLPSKHQLQLQPQIHTRDEGPRGLAELRAEGCVQPTVPAPLAPSLPILAHDRIILTKDDLWRIRMKSVYILVLGLLFPPLWVLMGWGHTLDGFILPPGTRWATVHQRQQILEVYRPFRRVAGVLSGIVLLGTLSGIVVGGLALGGIIG